MTLLEQIQKEIQLLPPEKQSEALDFILFLQKQSSAKPRRKVSIRNHPAYGSWKGRNINSNDYQKKLRSEWG